MGRGLLQGRRVMTTRLRLHPVLLFAVVGGALLLGVGAALPVWFVPHSPLRASPTPPDLFICHAPRGTLGEAVVGEAVFVHDFPDHADFVGGPSGENVGLALLLPAAGAGAGHAGAAGPGAAAAGGRRPAGPPPGAGGLNVPP